MNTVSLIGEHFDCWAVLGFRSDIIDYLDWYYEIEFELHYLKACTELTEIYI